ncbi:MAG: hypothetical protein IJF07_03695 [Lachnospiraceae bacterium]|nr:hypothetical protein [Lachnospiraceae bacterium]
MNIWEILEIEPTTDIAEIENACAKKFARLGIHASEEECRRLHEARQSAIQYAKQTKEYGTMRSGSSLEYGRGQVGGTARNKEMEQDKKTARNKEMEQDIETKQDSRKEISLAEVKIPQLPKQITFPKSITLPQNTITSDMIGKSSYITGIDQIEHPDKIDLPEGIDHPDRIRHPDRIEHPDKIDHPEEIEHPDKIRQADRMVQPDRLTDADNRMGIRKSHLSDRRDVVRGFGESEKRSAQERKGFSGSSELQNNRWNTRLKDWDIEENIAPQRQATIPPFLIRFGMIIIVCIVMIFGVRRMLEMKYINMQMQEHLESVTFESTTEEAVTEGLATEITEQTMPSSEFERGDTIKEASQDTEKSQEASIIEGADMQEEAADAEGMEEAGGIKESQDMPAIENDISEELANQDEMDYGVEYDGARAQEKLEELLELYDKMQELENEMF